MKKICLMFPFLIIIASCKKSVTPEVLKDIVLPAKGASVIQSNSNFAFDFLHAALQTDTISNNKLISPLSVYIALSMVDNGANNATKDSIEYALRLNNINIDDVNQINKILLQQLPSADNKISLSIANSIWYNKNINPLKSFITTDSSFYNASVTPLDFSLNAATQSTNSINNWVATNTQQKITKVIDNVSEDDLMYLINAIYFKGSWKYQFNSSNTKNASFYLSNNSIVSTPFMNVKNSFLYFGNDTLQVLQLPYGGGNFNMYALLPNQNISLQTFASSLNNNVFNNWINKLDTTTINVYLPKFKYSYSIDDMKPALRLMGMGIAFSESDADFSKMYDSNIPAYISKAIHKTYINVDEEGTEAAAVTVIGTTYFTSVLVPPTIWFNRPFVYVIQEKTSGTILFIGLMNNPTK